MYPNAFGLPEYLSLGCSTASVDGKEEFMLKTNRDEKLFSV